MAGMEPQHAPDKWAVIIVPSTRSEYAQVWQWARYCKMWISELVTIARKPFKITSIAGPHDHNGVLIGIGLSSRFIACKAKFPKKYRRLRRHEGKINRLIQGLATRQIVSACAMAARMGAKLVVLTGYTGSRRYLEDVVTACANNPATKHLVITSGNPNTIAVIVRTLEYVAGLMHANCAQNSFPDTESFLSTRTLGVVGGTGSIGKGVVQLLSPRFRKIVIFASDNESVERGAAELRDSGLVNVTAGKQLSQLKDCHFVITAATKEGFLTPDHFSPGTVVLDASAPTSLSRDFTDLGWEGILRIKAGAVEIPHLHCTFDLGYGKPTAPWNYVGPACFAEGPLIIASGRYNLAGSRVYVSPEQSQALYELGQEYGHMVRMIGPNKEPIDDQDIIDFCSNLHGSSAIGT